MTLTPEALDTLLALTPATITIDTLILAMPLLYTYRLLMPLRFTSCRRTLILRH